MKILVINAGSSSLKYQLMDMTDNSVIAKGIAERIGIEGSMLTYSAGDYKIKTEKPMANHTEAMTYVLEALVDKEHGVVKSMDEIAAVGHRVLHGGMKFACSVVINEQVMDAIRECIPLGPLHNPANLMGIEACREIMPNTPMVAVFDTAFGQTMPPKAYIYGLPYEDFEEFKIRRYGFHGTSHRFISKNAAEFLGKPIESLKIITCHLGNGSSVSAVNGGKCVDTSMGLTPLEGLVMGTRCGSIDPAIVPYLAEKRGLSLKEMDNYMNKKSGVLGVSGVSSDFRDLHEAAEKGNERAKLALEVFAYSVKKYIGAYAAAMNGVDVIVFTAGVGENDNVVRELIMQDMEYLGVDMDFELNRNLPRGKSGTISKPESKVKVLVLPTNEELVIALDTLELTSK